MNTADLFHLDDDSTSLSCFFVNFIVHKLCEIKTTRTIFKNDNLRRLNGWVFDDEYFFRGSLFSARRSKDHFKPLYICNSIQLET